MNVTITAYGAKPDGTLCTRAIQAAVDDCFAHGGGVVEVPTGTFLTAGVRLRSNITLLLRSGACLQGSRNPDDYLDFLSDEIEPLEEELRTDDVWVNHQCPSYDFFLKPCSRWNNGLIRAIRAHHVSIIGEEGSFIDGMDCYDPRGEENYRGPHAVSMHLCSDLRFSGYTVRNSGNWAHSLFDCRDAEVENVSVLAGHDGIHMTGCSRISIRNCAFYTGDDCVAGTDNTDLSVENCLMNTACSAFRMGGTRIRIRGCRMFGPARYLFRGSLSQEEKVSGVPTAEPSHRYNMLSAFTYYADFSHPIREQPGDIRLENCTVENVDRFLHYNFSGNETWQCGRPLKDVHFKNITVTGLKHPVTAYGDRDVPVICEIENCRFTLAEGTEGMAFMHVCNHENILLKDVHISGLKNAPLILRWSEGGLSAENLAWDDSACPLIRDADIPFVCRPI